MECRIGTIKQATNYPKIGLLDEFHVHKKERHIEPGQEGLAHHCPRLDHSPAADWYEDEFWIRTTAMRAYRVGGVGERAAN